MESSYWYRMHPRLARQMADVKDWLWAEGPKLCMHYENRKHHYWLWKRCPIILKPDTFRRILAEIVRGDPNHFGQERGMYWVC